MQRFYISYSTKCYRLKTKSQLVAKAGYRLACYLSATAYMVNIIFTQLLSYRLVMERQFIKMMDSLLS